VNPQPSDISVVAEVVILSKCMARSTALLLVIESNAAAKPAWKLVNEIYFQIPNIFRPPTPTVTSEAFVLLMFFFLCSTLRRYVVNFTRSVVVKLCHVIETCALKQSRS